MRRDAVGTTNTVPHCALGCNNPSGLDDSCPNGRCSASYASWETGVIGIHYYSYKVQPCDPDYSSHGGTDTCPNGWGTYFSYTKYQSGCNQGRYYPDAHSAYAGPSDVVGSPY